MRLIFAALFFFSLSSSAQWKSFIISVRGDTLNRVDANDKKQGPWVIHMDAIRGEDGYDEQGYFVDNKKDGIWVRFSLTGDKIAAENYRWGCLDGKAQYFNRTGALMREENWRAVDPNKTMDTVAVYDVTDPNKVIDRVEVKLEPRSYKHGTWTYYDTEWGTVSKREEYFLDKLKTNGEDDLKPLDAKAGKTAVKPKEVLEFEKKNSGKKKVRTRDGNTGY